MNFPPTAQDQFAISGDPTYSMGILTGDTQEVPRLDDGILTYHESTTPSYDKALALNSFEISELLFPRLFEPAKQATTEDTPASQPISPLSYDLSRSKLNISMDVPAMTTVAPALTIAPPTPVANVAIRRRFRCSLCPKTFDRLTRAETCYNEHLDWKRHMCHGVCGKANCTAAYFSIEKLHRHTRLPAKRKIACPYCSRLISKQNISRHKKSCT